jgi:hypothetical protein
MSFKLILIYHVILVAAVYVTGFRTGLNAHRLALRRKALQGDAHLMEMLEQLNLRGEEFLDEREKDGRR